MPKQTKVQKSNNGAVQPPDSPELRGRIEKRAHEIWLSSGRVHGNEIAHWLQAENEVVAELRRKPGQPL